MRDLHRRVLLVLGLLAAAAAPTTAMAGGILLYEAEARNRPSDKFGWGVAAEYACGGTLGVDRQGTSPVLGGRGTLSGAHDDTGILFLSVYGDWRP